MRVRTLRSAVPGLVLVAAMSLSISSCGIAGRLADRSRPTGATSTPAQLSPVEKLLDAAAKTNKGLITVVRESSGLKTDARIDPDARKATMSLLLGEADLELLRVDMIQIDTDLYLRMPDLPGQAEKWMRRDVADLPEGSPFRLGYAGDHTGAVDLANCVVSAKRSGGNEFTGTLDLTRSRLVPPKLVAELGPKADAVPFSARTSREGDLLQIIIDVPSVLPTQGVISNRYSRMDELDVERPAASDVTELPRSLVDDFDV
jgi:hypothetical protein